MTNEEKEKKCKTEEKRETPLGFLVYARSNSILGEGKEKYLETQNSIFW